MGTDKKITNNKNLFQPQLNELQPIALHQICFLKVINFTDRYPLEDSLQIFI